MKKIGIFQMKIFTMNVEIKNSPTEINVRPGPNLYSMSIVQGDGLSSCIAGITCTFTIIARDSSGNQGRGGDDIRVLLTGPCFGPLEDPNTQVKQEVRGRGRARARA
eukprot:765576-Hanusia_phi.AAC.1